MHPLKTYLVGGAVRDLILGKQPQDLDYVVVGASPEYMLENGFQQVGAGFPVFLHPHSGCEYALARTERKIGPGYTGFETVFDPTITIEEDLRRRDLTVNSIALEMHNHEYGVGYHAELYGDPPLDHAKLIDPFNGVKDLKDGVLRHTSEAFSEDPLRVLRLARFAARFNFDVALETMLLAQHLVTEGELEHLPHERMWKEIDRAVIEKHPHKFFEVLFTANAMNTSFMSEVFKGLTLERAKLVLAVTRYDFSHEARLGLLTSFWLHEPNRFKESTMVHWLSKQRASVVEQLQRGLDPKNLLSVLERARMFQASPKNDAFFSMISFLEVLGDVPRNSFMKLMFAFDSARTVNGSKVTADLTGKAAGDAVHNARLTAITAALS